MSGVLSATGTLSAPQETALFGGNTYMLIYTVVVSPVVKFAGS